VPASILSRQAFASQLHKICLKVTGAGILKMALKKQKKGRREGIGAVKDEDLLFNRDYN